MIPVVGETDLFSASPAVKQAYPHNMTAISINAKGGGRAAPFLFAPKRPP
jgi:hypothetical protein